MKNRHGFNAAQSFLLRLGLSVADVMAYKPGNDSRRLTNAENNAKHGNLGPFANHRHEIECQEMQVGRKRRRRDGTLRTNLDLALESRRHVREQSQ